MTKEIFILLNINNEPVISYSDEEVAKKYMEKLKLPCYQTCLYFDEEACEDLKLQQGLNHKEETNDNKQ
jgi:hypothetical protein